MGKSISDNFREFTTATQDYIESSIAYHKLDIFKSVMKGLIAGSYQLILGFLLLIALIFLSFAGAIYLGKLLDNMPLGYLIVGGIYVLIMIASTFFLKNLLEKTLLSKASALFFNKTEKIQDPKTTPNNLIEQENESL